MDGSRTRRAMLASLGTVVSLAGCLGLSDDSEPASGSETTSTGTEDPPTTESTPTGTDGSRSDLDLREANVLEATVESAGDGAFRFDVTLLHDDDGEDGYADWWQVETLSGEELGRRTLAHAHGTQPFTRSSTIDVPTDVPCVVVRGHDQTHGYGGQTALVDLSSGETTLHDQGPEPQTFESADCP